MQEVSERARQGWRIVARHLNEFGDTVYDVYEGDERRAWGIKDRASARRWLERLAGPEAADAARGQDGDASDENDDAPAAYSPRRVWWNET